MRTFTTVCGHWYDQWRREYACLTPLLLLLLASSLFVTSTYAQGDQRAASIEQWRSLSQQWSGGNINSSNSDYMEGESVPYRAVLTGLKPNTSTQIVISFQITKGNDVRHAIDYVTSFDRSKHLDDATVLSGTGLMNTYEGTYPLPQPSTGKSIMVSVPYDGAPGAVPQLQPYTSASLLPAEEKQITIWGGSGAAITGAAYYTANGYAGEGDVTAADEDAYIIITLNPGASTTAVLAWGGHIASRTEWGFLPSGVPRSATGISGSPYHMRLEFWESPYKQIGQQDASMQLDFITPPCNLQATNANTQATVTNGQTFECAAPNITVTNMNPGFSQTWTVTGPAAINSINGPTTLTGAASSITVYHTGGCGTITVTVVINYGLETESRTCTFSYSVIDEVDPVLTVPANVTVECNAIPSRGTATATDNCDTDVAVEYIGEVRTNGSCPDSYTLTRTWRATDNCGNSVEASQVITVQDTQDPVLAGIPANTTVECSAIPAPATPTATDNCDQDVTISYTQTRTNGSCPDSYTLTRTWTATDNCGNSVEASQVITVQDTQDPVLSGVPGPVTVECNAIPAPATPTATDNCDGDVDISYSQTRTDGACANSYTLTRTWTATDNCGNSVEASQVITVQDTQDPVLTVPANVTVQCNAIPAVGTATATDNCDMEVTVEYIGEVRTNGSCPDSYTLTRTWRATDNCGNSVEASQVITVQDTQAPTFNFVPANVTIQCHETPPAVGTPTATDNCDANVAIEYRGQVRTDGSCPDSYTLTRTWRATDNCGNWIDASQVITVQDIQKPTFTFVPANTTVQCDNIPAVGTPTATDNCDANVTIEYRGQVRTDGSCPDSYTLTRTWRATDNCGNWIDASQVITVQDIQKPTFTFVPANTTVQCDNIPVVGTPTATDNCDANVTIEYRGQVRTDGSCPDAYTLTRTWRATDNCGNWIDASQVITVEDTEDPVLSGVPGPVTVECNAIPAPATPTATDNCDANVTISYTQTRTNGSCPDSYTLTRTWTATDNCGNSTSASQVITVQDTQDPVLSGVPANTTVECNAIPAPATPTATDNCDANVTITYQETRTNGNCPSNYTLTRTWTATDNCGNSTSASQVITVQDTQAPTYTLAAVGVVPCNPSWAQIEAAFTAPTVADNCTATPTIERSYGPEQGTGCQRSIVLTWIIRDECGNTVRPTQTVNFVRDLTAPQVTSNTPTAINAGCNTAFVDLPWQAPTWTDNCSGVTLVSDVISPDHQVDACPGAAVYTRTWTVRDDCGNTAMFAQTITVPCCAACTYTQGFYGNYNGKACTESGAKVMANDLMTTALSGEPGQMFAFGRQDLNRYWVLRLSDVNKGKASNIFTMLPGGGSSQMLGLYTEPGKIPEFSNKESWPVAPLDTKKSTAGKIKNSLLAQTITLYFNLRTSEHLGAIPLESDILITAEVACGSSTPIPFTEQSFTLPYEVIAYLNDNERGYANTVDGLFQLANDVLGGYNPDKLSASAVSGAVDGINNAFDECRVLVGYSSATMVSTTSVDRNNSDLDREVLSGKLNVSASPNPYSDNVRFTIESPVSGQASLEVFNLLGQKLETVYQGFLMAGRGHTVEYKVAPANRTTLIYVLKVGDQQVTGKLLNRK